MIITLLLLLSALGLSAIAGYYSVIGMTAIFAAAWWPVVIMTGTLEFSKIVVASWLYRNWRNTPFFLKSYLTIAVIILMFITSLGIFGYLSKAHIDQGLGMGDTQLFVGQIEQQIQVERNRIDDNRKVIQQMDDAVASILAQSTAASAQRANRGSTMAQQASQLRDKQKKDRDSLNKLIDEANAKIRELNAQKLKLEQEQLKLEAEVGPIKYIAQMIYGDNPDKNLLEKAVRYVIILIILVFDPLAVLMIIAANMSMMQRSASKTPPRDPEPTREEPKPAAPAPAAEDKPMTHSEALRETAKNDERNRISWVEGAANSMSFLMPVPYNVPAKAEEEKPMAAAPQSEPQVIAELAPEPAVEEVVEVVPEPTPESITATVEEVATYDSNVQVVYPSVEVENIDVRKPDDILHTIKQYHNVRLDDAKRTIR